MIGTIEISESQVRAFREEGFFVLEGAIPGDMLEALRDEADRFVGLVDADMDRRGVTSLGITHRGSRYFISNRWRESDVLPHFLFGDLMEAICRATLGPNAWLFHEQWVIKNPSGGMKFSWHQDSGYVGFPHRPYVSCWCALDDVDEESGTVYVLPFSRAGSREIFPHVAEPGSNDLVGYTGDDPGVPVIGPAGTIAVFSSVSLHRSGANASNRPRRVYLPQYSVEPIYYPDGTTLRGLADPFLRDGLRVDPYRA